MQKNMNVRGVIVEEIYPKPDCRRNCGEFSSSWRRYGREPVKSARLIRRVKITDPEFPANRFDGLIPIRSGNSRLTDGLEVIFDISFDNGTPHAFRIRPAETQAQKRQKPSVASQD